MSSSDQPTYASSSPDHPNPDQDPSSAAETSTNGIHHIVWLDRGAVNVSIRRPSFPHTWTEYPHTASDQVVERLRNATIAINNKEQIGGAMLQQLPKLQFIAMCATGYDCLDLQACRGASVAASNVRDWSISVPEHVFALLLALRRDLFEYREKTRGAECAWRYSKGFTMPVAPLSRAQALRGSVIGIVGLGTLAERVVKVAEAFEMEVRIAERKGIKKGDKKMREGRWELEEVVRTCDALVLLCPLTEETRNLIGEEELKSMKQKSLVINCARGGVVNEKALVKALKEGWIAGAGVDVLTEEPPSGGNPLLDDTIPNLIVTPHVGWTSVQSVEILFEQLIGNIEAWVEGKPRNLVT